jgi:hypothetical protein
MRRILIRARPAVRKLPAEIPSSTGMKRVTTVTAYPGMVVPAVA